MKAQANRSTRMARLVTVSPGTEPVPRNALLDIAGSDRTSSSKPGFCSLATGLPARNEARCPMTRCWSKEDQPGPDTRE